MVSDSLLVESSESKIYDRELLSIMLVLQEFRKYLMNAKEVFEVWMDHSNLQYF